jgi:hypothetical protein
VQPGKEPLDLPALFVPAQLPFILGLGPDPVPPMKGFNTKLDVQVAERGAELEPVSAELGSLSDLADCQSHFTPR